MKRLSVDDCLMLNIFDWAHHGYDSAFIYLWLSIFEQAHEIMVLITQATSESSGEPVQSLRCSHTWSMESNQKSDI